jgi:hypothetical protein
MEIDAPEGQRFVEDGLQFGIVGDGREVLLVGIECQRGFEIIWSVLLAGLDSHFFEHGVEVFSAGQHVECFINLRGEPALELFQNRFVLD